MICNVACIALNLLQAFCITHCVTLETGLQSIECFPGMTSSLAKVNKSSGAYFLDAFSVILCFFDVPKYSDMFDYIKGRRPAVYFRNPKKSLHIIFKAIPLTQNQARKVSMQLVRLLRSCRLYSWTGIEK